MVNKLGPTAAKAGESMVESCARRIRNYLSSLHHPIIKRRILKPPTAASFGRQLKNAADEAPQI
jgi:hypothetical protein